MSKQPQNKSENLSPPGSDHAAAVYFPKSLTAEIDKWVAKYPPLQKQSALLPVLLLVQEHNSGWLSREYLDKVADYLGLPPIAVYEVATFYTMYNLQPIGRHQICVCTNVSCMLRGSDAVMQHLKKKLGIEIGQTTQDGLFTLKEVECLGACIGAPMMQINKEYYEHLTEEKIDQILTQIQNTDRDAPAGEHS